MCSPGNPRGRSGWRPFAETTREQMATLRLRGSNCVLHVRQRLRLADQRRISSSKTSMNTATSGARWSDVHLHHDDSARRLPTHSCRGRQSFVSVDYPAGKGSAEFDGAGAGPADGVQLELEALVGELASSG